jgi:SpoVK/Ycf46/Vps4 family AAA+-type ATPase
MKKLLRSYQRRDDQAFRATAQEIAQEERKKHHPVLANELERILENGESPSNGWNTGLAPFEPPPKDIEGRGPLFEAKYPERYLEDLVLDESVRRSIDLLVQEFYAWDTLQANGLLPARRVLFCGPPGCGKTATAEALSAEFGLPLLYVRFDAVVSSLLGETAANIRKVFDYARRGQWVVLFDEFDAIGRSRDDATEHGEIKRVVNSFLQIMDGFNGRSLVIAATNFEQALDPAVWRRFDDVVRFGKPDEKHLALFVRKRLAPARFQDAQVDTLVDKLSGLSFADAERVCLDIRKLGVLRGDRKVREDDIAEAFARHSYRRSVLEKLPTDGTAPIIDRE